MKNKILIAGCLIASLLLGLWILEAQGGPIRARSAVLDFQARGTNIKPWTLARTTYVDTNDTTPDPNGMTWQAAEGSYCALHSEQSSISIAFYCYGDGVGDGDPTSGSFDANIYLVEPYGGWEQIASITCAVGEMELTHCPYDGTQINSGSLDPNESYKWVEGSFTDNLNDATAWPAQVTFSGRTNGIGRLTLDPLGAAGVVILIDNMSGITRVYPLMKDR